ncbi:hypothetical protein L226DRAFT_27057 [Lentinus tigrinus ALCF2SS1-7]|uniref:uncharacterized protein n=1 Tax=Lentinus tigrinus ALCF2SS1-7 TaxID=1328758 RepID=UPI0011661E76|nr:hypothetical protein L226DRAFT_27057 [Lentinus tigrinus ALCF2SS1-7]
MENQLDPNHPPPTQGRIFVNTAQQPLRVFVEPSEVPNRTKLIRTLKTSGASTCEDVAEADIIVVAPETASSKELIEGWNEKVFLDVDWAYESIRRGRVYLEDENWGGFNVNTNAGASGSNATIHKSPLPTPRETPSDSQPQQETVMQQQQAPHPELLQFVQAGSPVPVSQFPQQQQIPQQIPSGVPMQGIPQNYPIMVPATMIAQLMGITQQQGMPPGIGMAQIPQMPVNMLSAGQVIPPGFIPQAIPFIAQPGMFPQGGFPMVQQAQPFASQLMNAFPQPMDVESPVAGSSHHNSSSPDMQRRSSVTASYRGSPMDEDERLATPESEGRHHTSRPHAREDERNSSKRRRGDGCETPGGLGLFMKRPGEPYLFFVQVEIRNRAKIADPIKKHGGKLVPDINQADFVILGHPATTNFEEWLRQSAYYGKLPLKPQWVFDCLEEEEIVDVDDYVYEGLRVERKRGRRSKTGQRYIVTAVKSGSEGEGEGEDEEEAEESEDEDEHERRGLVKKKRKVENSVKQVKVKAEKRKAQDEKKEKKVKKERMKEKGTKKKASHKTVQEEDATKSNGKTKPILKDKGKAPAKAMSKNQESVPRGPPSPPPPTIIVAHSTGKHFYTKEDCDYCDEYIPILLARDYTMSNSTIAEKLHAKMPHHSVASWMTHLSSTSRREKLAQLRRRAEIQHRKVAAQANGQPSTSHASRPPSTTSQQPLAVSTPTAGRLGASDSVLVNPHKTMAEFFANGRADNLEDAAVWQVMAQEHPELDAQGWEDYWSKHNDSIATEVARLAGLQSSDWNGEGPKAEPE